MLLDDKIKSLRPNLDKLQERINDPMLVKDNRAYAEVMREYSYLTSLFSAYDKLQVTRVELASTNSLLAEETNTEMKMMIQEELEQLTKRLAEEELQVKLLVVPPDPLDGKDIIMEIRAGTGGDEAALFAGDLYRMYQRYAEEHSMKIELLSISEQEQGGVKEIIYSISGKEVYGNLRYESGTHRVQRIPVTESGGRIHTSAATVAVLPEAEEVDVQIEDKDLRIDTYRSQGAGGQHVNTTDSAVRITHLPTGIVVQCQDERSQIKNRAKAMKMLMSRLFAHQRQQMDDERASERKSQVGSGDRSERIRTYNFPQNRVTDHRINLTLYNLDTIIQGDLAEIIEALKIAAKEDDLQV